MCPEFKSQAIFLKFLNCCPQVNSLVVLKVYEILFHENLVSTKQVMTTQGPLFVRHQDVVDNDPASTHFIFKFATKLTAFHILLIRA